MSDTSELARESRGCAQVEFGPAAQGGLALEMGYYQKHTRQIFFFFSLEDLTRFFYMETSVPSKSDRYVQIGTH